MKKEKKNHNSFTVEATVTLKRIGDKMKVNELRRQKVERQNLPGLSKACKAMF